ncbi:Lrp/AsnC family transcriptional regulator [Modestobacter sp. DSM 44400]|uniref:Lrp/AsnC family transcriptional regulator n=1 Tax=Modestobacter sp. DSM 44400 TaxID=1550230 RepID=UPI000B806C2B|nr:Lrp/AsnC family transcriptional regulator [Modestobacter sp. DSM 44400]
MSIVDDIDRGIVAFLRRDGRATFAEIGAAVGLSAPATKRRVDRLVADGAISGFTAIVDPHALGWDTEAYVEVAYNGVVSPSRLRADYTGIAEVVSAWTVSGVADAVVHVLARDVRHLEETIQRIRGLPDVTGTQTEIVLSRLFQRSPD